MRFHYLAAVAALLSAGVAARADTFSTFAITGSLRDAGTFTGSMIIDTTTGIYESGELVYMGQIMDDTIQASGATHIFFGIITGTPGTQYNVPRFEWALHPYDLTGYTGGPLCSVFESCQGAASAYAYKSGQEPEMFIFVLSGEATFVSSSDELAATPEPSSLMLLGTGVAAGIGVGRRKLRLRGV